MGQTFSRVAQGERWIRLGLMIDFVVVSSDLWTRLYPCRFTSGTVCPFQSACVLWSWTRFMTMSPWEVLLGVLWVFGSLLRAFRSLYTQSEICVRNPGPQSNTFLRGVGLRQSCPLSPILFVIFMDRISRHRWGKESVSGWGTSELCLCSLQMMCFCWLDQTVTFSTHWGGLQPSVK